MTRRCARTCGFTMLEVMISIAILAMLSAALITFGFGLAGRRDRLVREGDRSAVLARVLDRIERTASSAEEDARHGEDWLELSGRGVWPATDRAGVPAGPVGYTGRLRYTKDTGELTWREAAETGESVELVVGDIEAVLVDHFDDLVTTSGSRPPLRVCVWLARPGWEPSPVEDLELVDSDEMFDPVMGVDLGEEELPARPADVVFIVPSPAGGNASQGQPAGDDMGAMP